MSISSYMKPTEKVKSRLRLGYIEIYGKSVSLSVFIVLSQREKWNIKKIPKFGKKYKKFKILTKNSIK